MEAEQQQRENQSNFRKDEHHSILKRVDRGVENLRSGGASPRGSSPRGASPVSNLSVPGQRQYDDGEQFLSGHLLLAKKLSDEADESDKLRKMESLKETSQYQSSHQSVAEPYKPKQPLTKQKLSRQLSLQGSEDPRLKQGHQPLRGQMSCDPRHLGQRYSADPNQSQGQGMLLSDFMQSQTHHTDRMGYQHAHSTTDLSPSGHMVGGQEYHGNPALTRLPSAPPDPYMRQHPPPGVSLMMRQNSTSDPQLHKLDQEDPRHFIMPMANLGTMPMKDTTGQVTFQIGGSQLPKSGIPLSHGHISPGYNQVAPSQPFSPNQYGSMPVSMVGVPYMRPHMLAQPQTMSPPHPQAYSQNFSPPYSIGVTSQRPVRDMTGQNVCDTTSPYLNSPSPSQTGRVSMSPSMGAGSNMSGYPSPHPGPLPEDAPILAGDPRYKLYYHLCGLFPEQKVRTVMNLHPESVDPNEICAYILGMNKG